MLGIDHAIRGFHEAHVLLVKKTPSPQDIADAEAHASKGLKVLRHINALIAMGIYENAPAPPPDGEPLFNRDGSPTVSAAIDIPASEDPHIARQRMDCAREILSMFEELGDIPAVEIMDKLSRTWNRDKIVRPVLKRFTESGVLSCEGNTRGAVYSLVSACLD